MEDFPFKAEYSKSSRASCKACKRKIDKDVLRLAVMVQSPMFDGKVPNWYHSSCFFTKQRPKSIADIGNCESLRWEDQETIKKEIESLGCNDGDSKLLLKDYRTEYAKSNKSTCRSCNAAIKKGEVRISKKDFDSDISKRYGPTEAWHHLQCFVENREELSYFESADRLPGFKTLSKEDQIMLKSKLKKMKRKAVDQVDGAPPVKVKVEDTSGERKIQNEQLFKIRDKLSSLTKTELEELLAFNELEPRSSPSTTLDHLADVMTFGVPLPCDKCNSNHIVFRSGIGYQCSGDLTEWTKCKNVFKDPPKRIFKVPDELKEEYSFLKKFKGRVQTRIFDEAYHQEREKAFQKDMNSKVAGSGHLQNMVFSIDVDLGRKPTHIKYLIEHYGGKVTTNPRASTAALISTKENISNKTPKVLLAERHHVHVVPVEFLDEVIQGGAIHLVAKMAISPWGSDVEARLHQSSKSISGGNRSGVKAISGSATMVIKNGAVVFPESNLVYEAHVLKNKNQFYSAVLNKVDLSRGTNAYYKLQLLESDDTKRRKYWVFRAWGRIGTTIGGTKVESCASLDNALDIFNEVYEDKTGNYWGSVGASKIPGKFFPVEIEMGNDIVTPDLKGAGSKSKLKQPIIDLVLQIFDIDAMKKSLIEFELDLKKMPLGNISKRQIKEGYKVLSEASNLILSNDTNKTQLLLDCSNRFYSLIPHDFGMNVPPLLDNSTIIQHKSDMLENLLEIALAYNILKKEEGEKVDETIDDDIVDKYYRCLKTDIDVVEEGSEEFQLIERYLKNTHAKTHQNYELDLLEVFTIARRGEAKRYKPYKKLHNRKLLWHGSRLTNYAGIISQGLRIAPPEAPTTGYMFGKGIYFADIMSKSANYCFTSPSNPIGLMLLCEVALGNMHELTKADFITTLPPGKHSTKGVGRHAPDPSASVVKDDVEVPLGLPVRDKSIKSDLLYNEYIVYDPSQVNIKYLLKTRFRFKYNDE